MDKINELSKKQKYEEKILVSNVFDKFKKVSAYNKSEHTNFLDLAQQSEVESALQIRRITNYEFQGGYEEAERKVLIIYPEKHLENIQDITQYKKDILEKTIEAIKITIPKEVHGKYEHRTYLGSLMKLGIERKMIGDIIVKKDGANILICKDMAEYIKNNLKNLTRFQKASIEQISVGNLEYEKIEKETIKINVKSMRLDSIVAELINCSRNEANRIIEQERVYVNFKVEVGSSRKIKENTFITVRGKGRFKILHSAGQTKGGRIILNVEK